MLKKNLQNIQHQFSQAALHNNAPSDFYKFIVPGGTLKNPQSALGVYARAYKATLTDALGETFEGIWSVLGDEQFFAIAEEYIKIFPSTSYNLSDYGHAFPHFLKNHAEIKYPFLPALARFEWLFKDVFNAACPKMRNAHEENISYDGASKINFIASMRIFKSDFSIYDVWQMRKEQECEVQPNIYEPESLLLYKSFEDKIWVVKLAPWQYSLLLFLIEGNCIEDALTKIGEEHEFEDLEKLTLFFKDLRTMALFSQ